MKTPLANVSLKNLCQQPVMFDANIFMVGIENRISNRNCSFENMKKIYLTPLLESFSQIYIHNMVYMELDDESRQLVDEYKNSKKNIFIVDEIPGSYDTNPQYNTIFNNIANHPIVQYERNDSRNRGEVYSLAYAAYNGINFFCSKDAMVDIIAEDIEDLGSIEIITFDVLVLLAYVFHNKNGEKVHNKALKSIYKEFCEDVIKRHNLPTTLIGYIEVSKNYLV